MTTIRLWVPRVRVLRVRGQSHLCFTSGRCMELSWICFRARTRLIFKKPSFSFCFFFFLLKKKESEARKKSLWIIKFRVSEFKKTPTHQFYRMEPASISHLRVPCHKTPRVEGQFIFKSRQPMPPVMGQNYHIPFPMEARKYGKCPPSCRL
jgi:hypothetical protein